MNNYFFIYIVIFLFNKIIYYNQIKMLRQAGIAKGMATIPLCFEKKEKT